MAIRHLLPHVLSVPFHVMLQTSEHPALPWLFPGAGVHGWAAGHELCRRAVQCSLRGAGAVHNCATTT